MAMIGRLKPGVTAAGAQAELKILAAQLTAAHPERNTFEGNITPLAEHVSGRIRPALLVLIGAVGVVMLIVCANLSNMLLARTAARQKEIAIRTALGAGRGRLIRQMLTEGVTLSCCGAVLGIILAVGGTRLLASLEALSIPLLANVRVDFTVLGVLPDRGGAHRRGFRSCPGPASPAHSCPRRPEGHDARHDWRQEPQLDSERRSWFPRSPSPACSSSVQACSSAASFACLTSILASAQKMPPQCASIRTPVTPRSRNRTPTSMTSCAAFEPSRGLRPLD